MVMVSGDWRHTYGRESGEREDRGWADLEHMERMAYASVVQGSRLVVIAGPE